MNKYINAFTPNPCCISHSFIMTPPPPPCVFCFPAASFQHEGKAADFCSHRNRGQLSFVFVLLLAATVRGAAAANHVYQTPTLTLLICLLSVTLTAAKACRV